MTGKRKPERIARKLRYGVEDPCCGRCKLREHIHTGARPMYQCRLTGDYHTYGNLCPQFRFGPKSVPIPQRNHPKPFVW